MRVHHFGATPSPGCSNLTLKTTTKDGKEEFGEEAAAFLENSLYVDDGLKSVETVDQATVDQEQRRNVPEKKISSSQVHRKQGRSHRVHSGRVSCDRCQIA